MTICAFVFDAYGTLYDVQSVRGLAADLCGDKGELITQVWRLKQLEYTWLKHTIQLIEGSISHVAAADAPRYDPVTFNVK